MAHPGLATTGTGHALTAGGSAAQQPEHLVLVGGGAADLAELAEPIETGLLIPALSLHGAWVLGRRGAALAEGVSIIRDGRVPRGGRGPHGGVRADRAARPVSQALTARQRTVPPPVQRSARTAQAAVVSPGVRFGGGMYVTP